MPLRLMRDPRIDAHAGPMRTRTAALYVAACRARVWRALTDPALTPRYYLGLAVGADWRAGGAIAYTCPGVPGATLTGEILLVEDGRRLLHSLHADGAGPPDPHTWVEWTVAEAEPGLCRVTLRLDDLDTCPDADADEAWDRLLSGLKTVLETGGALAPEPS